MDKLTVFRILKSFSKKEADSFEEFIRSPYNNKAEYVVNYFDAIRALFSDPKNDGLSPEKIFERLYPGKKYNDATIRKLNSELLKLAERFLVVNALKGKKLVRESILLEELNERKIDTHFHKKLQGARLLLEDKTYAREEYYKEINSLDEIEMRFHSVRDRKKGVEKYFASIETLDKYYTLQKLRKLTTMSLEGQVFKGMSVETGNMQKFIKSVVENNFFGLPAIEMHYNIFLLCINMSEKYFFNLKKLLAVHKQDMSSDELDHAYVLMLNFCIFEHNKGSNKFNKEELGIYKNMMADGLLLFNNVLEGVVYKNIVSCALEAKDLSFAERFIEEYKDNIYSDDKESIVAYCRANLAYAGNDHNKALEILSKINFADMNQKLSLRLFVMRIFFEKEMYDQAFASIDALKHTLKREADVPEKTMKLYVLFSAFYERLLKAKLKPDKIDSALLKKEIERSQSISKNWLLKQC